MFVPIHFVAFFMILLVMILCHSLYVCLSYRNIKMILREYENIARGYDELQEGIGKYRESSTPLSQPSSHYYVGAAGSRNAANTYRR